MNGIEDEVIEKKDLSRPYFPRKYGERVLLDLLCCYNYNCLLACLLACFCEAGLAGWRVSLVDCVGCYFLGGVVAWLHGWSVIGWLVAQVFGC